MLCTWARLTLYKGVPKVMFQDEAQWEAQLKGQREREERSLRDGGDRFRKKLEMAREQEQQSSVGGPRRLLTHGLVKLEAGIDAYLVEAKAKRGAKHCAIKWIEEVGPDVAAYITLKTVLDEIESKRPLSLVSRQITQYILDELRYRRFKKQQPALFEYKLGTFKTSSYSHMARRLNSVMNYVKVDVTDLQVKETQRILIGAKLIDLLIQTTGLVDVVNSERTKKGKRFTEEAQVVANPETLEWLTQANNAMEFLQPVVYPMTVPPLQWEKGQRGGYRFALRGKYCLTRKSNFNEAWSKELELKHLPVVYEALNSVQNTAWKINPFVLQTVENILTMGGGVAGIPVTEPDALPAKPATMDTDEVARKAWRKAAHLVYEKNIARRIRMLEVFRVLGICRTLKDEQAIWFPHNLDFRGRVYPIPNYLSPQGDDVSKGMLTFAQGKVMDYVAAKALAIHGANCLDTTPEGIKISKLTLNERVDWIEDHSQQIEDAGRDPMGYTWWMTAEEPLQFLAFCKEWLGWKTDGTEYVCALPISVDGSCNGLQHFSAMLKDEIGGAAVNVVPQDKPQDIYDIIATKVRDSLEVLAASGDLVAGLWLSSGLVTRKLTKRPTMTFGYGSKQFGFQNQTQHFLSKDDASKWPAIRTHFTVDGTQYTVEACKMMAQHIWDALQTTVVAAGQGMAWMQQSARIISKQGKPIGWLVPTTGFPVRQEYYQTKARQVDTMICGRLIKPSVPEDTDQIELHRQVNAIAPNVVHSLDAAALMHTVRMSMHEGVDNFACVHDSYGCVPSDMAVVARNARISFIKLYGQEVSVIADLYTQFTAQAGGEELPVPPSYGKLEISSVLASDYFFA